MDNVAVDDGHAINGRVTVGVGRAIPGIVVVATLTGARIGEA